MANEQNNFDLSAGARHALRGFRKPDADADTQTIKVSRKSWQRLCDAMYAPMNGADADAQAIAIRLKSWQKFVDAWDAVKGEVDKSVVGKAQKGSNVAEPGESA